jgi:hypothetical protein
VPVWHEARRELPFVFAGQRSGGRPAGACRDQGDGDAARAAARRAVPSRGRRPFARLAKGCTAAGAALIALAGRRRAGAAVGGGCSLLGGCSSAWSAWLSTEPALSRPPTRSTQLCHHASAPPASAAKRRRVLLGAELAALSVPGEVEGHDERAIGPGEQRPKRARRPRRRESDRRDEDCTANAR